MIWRRDSLMSIISEDRAYAIARTDDMSQCCFLLFYGKAVIANAWTDDKSERSRGKAIDILKQKADDHAARTGNQPGAAYPSKFR